MPHASASQNRLYAAQDTRATFADYDRDMGQYVSNSLPPDLAKNHVVSSLRIFLTAVSAEAQLQSLVAEGSVDASTNDYKSSIAAIRKNENPPHFGAGELKSFTRLLFDTQTKHGAADFLSNTLNDQGHLSLDTTKPGGAISTYLSAYYSNKFYDRMGTQLSKPGVTISQGTSAGTTFSLPDSQITAAETVLLEYLGDLVFPTPVMGDGVDAKSSKNFYPGNSPNEPTALTTGNAGYLQLEATGCGITQQNVWVLKDLANGASDQAATVGGLIVNTPGGLSFGLGVIGKISIGDNQTLSDLVKTAASEIALRATLDAAYYSLRHVNFPIPEPGT